MFEVPRSSADDPLADNRLAPLPQSDSGVWDADALREETRHVARARISSQISSPSAIASIGMPDCACYRLHFTVDAFQKRFRKKPDPAGFERMVAAFNSLEPPPSEAGAIESLSSPLEYESLRQRSRSRGRYPPLGPEEMSSLCSEIRAALIWAALPERRCGC